MERAIYRLYKHPRALYTNKKQSFIYFLVRVKLEENMKQNRTEMAKAMLLKLKAMRDINLAKLNGGA